MNTIRSTWMGWGVLMVAGAGSYYYAKKSVNADRAERQEQELRRRRLQRQMEEREMHARTSAPKKSPKVDHAARPSGEASEDPAPTRHTPGEPAGGSGGPANLPEPPEKSKYEPSEIYRSKKGDRFS